MTERVFNVLFLSRRNSARSLMAEALLNKLGDGRFRAYSAAIEPAAEPDRQVLELLALEGVKQESSPKHYLQFVQAGAPELDFVFTLSDTAAGEALPEWPGRPVTAHWHCDDPMKVIDGSAVRKQSLARTMAELERRLKVFISLPLMSLDRMSAKASLDAIGKNQL